MNFTKEEVQDMINAVNNIWYLFHQYPSENSFNDIMIYSEIETQLRTLQYYLGDYDDKN